MKSRFNIIEGFVSATPRSQRKKNAASGSGSTVVVGGSGGESSVTDPNSHTHTNLALLESLADQDGYLTKKEENPDTGEDADPFLYTKFKSGFADKAGDSEKWNGKAFDDYLNQPVRKEDVVTFKQVISTFFTPEFVSSLFAGKGAGIDQAGNAEFESVRVRSALEVLELLVNRLSAIEGDQVLTEADTIERVEDLGDGCYGLHLRSKWEGYFTAQVENNVLEGIINTLATGSGEYRTSWMRVNSVNAAANYIEVVLYPDEETPAGKNYPPTELMRIARRGNQTDPTRQRCLYLSSTEGRIVRLTGVTKPILDASNYGATLGTLPEFLTAMGLPVIEGQDYVYARGLIVQDIIRIDYQGHPIAEVVDRGPWAAGESYYASALNPSTGRYETSDVWYSGCRYRCAKTGTTAAPAWNSTAWAMVEGNPEFTVSFADTDNIFDPDRFAVTLTVVARLYNLDVTSDILDTDVVWTRYSEDADGVERVASDQAWALRRGGAGKSLDLTAADCDFNGYIPRTLRFTATVTLRDGMGEAAASAAAVFEY